MDIRNHDELSCGRTVKFSGSRSQHQEIVLSFELLRVVQISLTHPSIYLQNGCQRKWKPVFVGLGRFPYVLSLSSRSFNA